MTKLEEMQKNLKGLIDKMQNYLDNDRLDEAEKVKSEISQLTEKIEKQKYIDSIAIPEKHDVPTHSDDKKSETADFIRACIKKFSGKSLSPVENSLLLPTSLNVNGANGEGYILPQDIQTKIREKVRQFRSLREVCGAIQTTALKGAFPVENLDSMNGLVDFTDGSTGSDSTDFSFSQVTFSLKEKAGFIKISNTLLALTDNDLIDYIVNIFAKKTVITENTMAVTAITSGKTVKTLANWQALQKSINVDLDPAAWNGTVIVTNQDGFDVLDGSLDQNGRPLLQPDISNPSVMRFRGFPVHVFSNAMLPSTAPTSSVAGFAPIYYGNLETGVKFVDLNVMSFATSTEAGFMENMTVARIIEFVDVIQNDGSDACYMVGKLQYAPKTS